jgi:glyceraldehyde 3-phosphate dehydrogenase
MAVKVGINGFGRIGRCVTRVLSSRTDLELVGINDLTDNATLAHLLKYDSVHGPFQGTVSSNASELIINGKAIRATSERDPSKLPWGEMGADIVLECTGVFEKREKMALHLDAGAKHVLLSAPAKGAIDLTVVMGVNDNKLDLSQHKCISNASCTTNCLAPVAKVLHDSIGIVNGLMTTIHAYTNDQVLTDVYHEDLRRARSATQSMIPTKTGAAAAVGLVLPELNGRLDGFAMRVPTINVSIVDLSFVSARATTVDEINGIMKTAAAMPGWKGVLGYSDGPLVSVDFNHDAHSSTFDATLTKVSGNLVKVCSWYDNEWGFSNRMLDTTLALMAAK